MEVFLVIVLGIIALALLVFGILTAYFGKGKARAVGGGMIVGSIILMLITYFLSDFVFHFSLINEVVLGALFYLIAAVIGLIIGLLIFLGAIMKT
jgi:hypothetical protein